jgi:hypothetical protein
MLPQSAQLPDLTWAVDQEAESASSKSSPDLTTATTCVAPPVGKEPMATKRRQYLHRYSRRSGGRRRGRDRLVSKRSVIGYKLSTITGRRFADCPSDCNQPASSVAGYPSSRARSAGFAVGSTRIWLSDVWSRTTAGRERVSTRSWKMSGRL